MVPCPSALVLLLAAVAMQRIAFGLALIVAFSLGLAAVLVLIGLLVVKSTGFMLRNRPEGRWVKVLPVCSAGIIMLVGVAIAVQGLAAAGVLPSNFGGR
jgi:nickel/cobalt transporter (NicO) family protein